MNPAEIPYEDAQEALAQQPREAYYYADIATDALYDLSAEWRSALERPVDHDQFARLLSGTEAYKKAVLYNVAHILHNPTVSLPDNHPEEAKADQVWPRFFDLTKERTRAFNEVLAYRPPLGRLAALALRLRGIVPRQDTLHEGFAYSQASLEQNWRQKLQRITAQQQAAADPLPESRCILLATHSVLSRQLDSELSVLLKTSARRHPVATDGER